MKSSGISAFMTNALVGFGVQLCSQIAGFCTRTLFIRLLGITYLGVNGVFSNLFALLSLLELGIGTAFSCELYRSLATKDVQRTAVLMAAYAKEYKLVAVAVTVGGLALTPCLLAIIPEGAALPEFVLLYLLLLANEAVTYLFSHRRTLLIADQKNYICLMNSQFFALLAKLLQIAVLLWCKSFFLYGFVQVCCSLLSAVTLYLYTNHRYPYLKSGKKEKLPKAEQSVLFRNVRALFGLRVGSVVLNGTDQLLLTYFAGLATAGMYANYILLIGIVQGFLSQLLFALTSAVGNLLHSSSQEKQTAFFSKLFLLTALLYGSCGIGFFLLLNPFIGLWLGEAFLLGDSTVLLLVGNLFLLGMRQALHIYRNVLGLFRPYHRIALAQAAVNLLLSVLLAKQMGINGVLLGTMLSFLVTWFVFEPLLFFKQQFGQGAYSYWKRYGRYAGLILLAGVIVTLFTGWVDTATWQGLFLKAALTACGVIGLFWLLFHKTEEFRYLWTRLNHRN